MTNELVPHWDVKESVILIKNSMDTGLLTTTELDRFLRTLGDEGLKLFFQKIPTTKRDFVPDITGGTPQDISLYNEQTINFIPLQ
jgi:hypothetical protein